MGSRPQNSQKAKTEGSLRVSILRSSGSSLGMDKIIATGGQALLGMKEPDRRTFSYGQVSEDTLGDEGFRDGMVRELS